MAIELRVSADTTELRRFAPERLVLRAAARGGSSAIRAARTQASREVRARKALKASKVAKALKLRFPSGTQTVSSLAWHLDVDSVAVPLTAYPFRQVAAGVSVRVNRGAPKLLRSAFVTTLRSGHVGVFRRVGAERLPIKELFTTRVTDVFDDSGMVDRVFARAGEVFTATFRRNLEAVK
jgi:hypothetical protein